MKGFGDINKSKKKKIKKIKSSKEEIINQAILLHLKGNIKEAEEYYQQIIKKGCTDDRVFSNYSVILQSQGELNKAELYSRTAIAINPKNSNAYLNLGNILQDYGKLQEAEFSYRKAIELNPKFADAAWNLYGISNNIDEAEKRINLCLTIDQNHLKAKLTLSALKFHQGDQSLFDHFMKSNYKDHPIMRSLKWVSTLPKLPELYFHRWAVFDDMTKISEKNRPFYEFGVWRGESFKYLINTFKKGYGFDTFNGIPEDWHDENIGQYSAKGIIPKIDGGTVIAGKFEDTLPKFFSNPRPIASIVNFDADLYSSTLCALNFSKPIIDKKTILIFDEFLTNKNWELDEYKALNEFCSKNNFNYEVLAVSYISKQVAVRLI